jgi:NADPH:quinone reductase-like Zn-dependent oxidoreductase
VRGAYFTGKDLPLEFREVADPQPTKDHVLIRLHAAALNHRDLWIKQEQSQAGNGIILGSDGAGVIEKVGEEGDPDLVGRHVMINPAHEWGKESLVQGDAFKILGYPDHGTFATHIIVNKKYVHDKPEYLSFEEAAAVPLSGLTAYRALFTKARLRPGEKVLVTGIGGGAALWALQLATGFGATVFVTSSSQEKIEKAKALGAAGGFNYKETDWADRAKKINRGFDVIIDSAGGEQFNSLMDVAIAGGRIAIFGRTAGNIPDVSPRTLYWKQLSIFGSTMGTRDEFLSLLDFIEKKKVKPVIDEVIPFNDLEEGFKRMGAGRQFGKIVVKIV